MSAVRPHDGERARPGDPRRRRLRRRGSSFDASLDELALLAESAGDVAVARVVARRKAPDAAFFVGSGKADEMKELVQLHQAEAVLFDQALSPAQQRNLERHLGVAVADRTMLILEIFGAARAEPRRQAAGRAGAAAVPVDAAGAALEPPRAPARRHRHRGGPGEAQIELDRRMIGERIKSVKKQLERVKRQRSTQRRARERNADVPRLARRLHQRRQVDAVQRAGQGRGLCRRPAVRDARHDDAPALPARGWRAASSLSDTVGFIRDLPHKLIEAFQATLQEAADADLLLHVVDGAQPGARRADARRSSACSPRSAPATCRRSWSSTSSTARRDRAAARPRRHGSSCRGGARVPRVFVSALSGEGLDALRALHRRVAAAGAALNPARRPHLTIRSGAHRTAADDGDEPSARAPIIRTPDARA